MTGEKPTHASETLQLAYENTVPHITNLGQLNEIIADLKHNYSSINTYIAELEKIADDANVTLRTDIKILLNEIRHIIAGQKSNERV